MVSQKPRVLVIDDEQVVCNVLYDELSERGYLCTTVLSGDDALDKLSTEDFQVVLLDIRLPGMSGMELLSRIRPEHPNTSIIMITGVCNADTMVEAFRLGALHYVMKPLDLNELSATIRLALETKEDSLERKDYFEELVAKVTALEKNNKYTSGHSQRVVEISVSLAQQLDLPQSDIDKIEIAALVHDIGMIGVSESIPLVQGKLDWRLFQRIVHHCKAGERILAHVVKDNKILSMVRHHHERYDGGGYPDGLCGDAIPLGARILAVAEAYDAMTSQRPHRAAMSSKVAYAEIERCKSSQFDPEVADAFLRINIIPSKRR